MKIVNAFWERRNLGLNVAEIEVEFGDSLSQLDGLIALASYDYLVVRLPTKLNNFAQDLEKKGFRFLETQVALSKDLEKDLNIPAEFDSLLRKIEVKTVNDSADMENILSSIDVSMFGTDRISTDPLFGPKIGMGRYKNWIRDEVEFNQSTLAELLFNKKSIGFFILRHLEGVVYFATLAGIYKNFRGRGLGFSVVAKPLEFVKNQGGRYVRTRNSTNNPESLKLHLACGYKIDEMFYIFRWSKTN